MKLVSILMPTINPETMLHRALRSIKETATDFDQVEILLRVDSDNHERLSLLPRLEEMYGVRHVAGPRGLGYTDMGKFVDELVAIADSKWCWLFDDDSWVEGDWQTPLSKIACSATHGPAVRAQKYQLGHSTYDQGGGCVGLIMPTSRCKTLVHSNPVDIQWFNLAASMGWKTKVLHGVTYGHDGRPR